MIYNDNTLYLKQIYKFNETFALSSLLTKKRKFSGFVSTTFYLYRKFFRRKSNFMKC